MEARPLPRSLARYAPLAAAILGSAAFAAPAGAQAPAAPPAPAIVVGMNTSSVVAEDLSPTDVTVRRGATLMSTGTFVDNGDGAFTVNDPTTAADGLDVGCWDPITPQMLPGDVVTVAGEDPITLPDITAEAPVVEGGDIVVHGTAKNLPAGWAVNAQLHPPVGGRFNGAGSSGGAFLDTGLLRGFNASLSFDAGSATNWTARFSGLGDNFALAAASAAVAEAAMPEPAVEVAGAPPLMAVDYEAGAVGADVGGCGAPYSPNEARTASRSLINMANAGQDLTITGVAQPGASASLITLIDSTGRTVTAPAFGGASWTSAVPAATLAGLADGAIRIGSTFTPFGNGATVGGLVRKDTTAPSAVTASVASGAYTAAQNVALKSNDGTIKYTTDGSDPTASSKSYTGPVNVAQSQSIKAIAIDAAGNASEITRFDYAIGAPRVAPSAPVTVKLPKLKLESLTFTKKMSLRSARQRGFSAIVYAPEGAKIAHVRILKGAKVIQTINRKISRDGVLEIRMPSKKALRKKLRKGSYRVEIQVGQNLNNLGRKSIRNIRLK